MIADYPEIVSKLSLLMGAGMSTYNALIKITEDYKKQVKQNRHMNYFPNALTEYLQELRRQMRIWNLVKDAMLCVI